MHHGLLVFADPAETLANHWAASYWQHHDSGPSFRAAQ